MKITKIDVTGMPLQFRRFGASSGNPYTKLYILVPAIITSIFPISEKCQSTMNFKIEDDGSAVMTVRILAPDAVLAALDKEKK